VSLSNDISFRLMALTLAHECNRQTDHATSQRRHLLQ